MDVLTWIRAGIHAGMLTAFAAATPAYAIGPNILLVLIDDLRPIATAAGQPSLTPNLDALAARGFRFVNNYANVPVCGASRASMLSGLAPTPARFISFDARLDADVPGAESLPAFSRQF